MVICKLTCIGFKGSDDHTVGYRKKATQFLTGSSEPSIQFDIERDIEDKNGNFKLTVGERVEDARETMRQQLAQYIGTVSYLEANLDDFYFEVVTSDVKDGMFWLPGGQGTRQYLVSNGELL